MNTFELVVIAFSGLLLSVVVSDLLIDSIMFRGEFINGLELKSVLLVYERGSLLNASFNASLSLRSDYLRVTPDLVVLGNASSPNPGLPSVTCDGFSELIISEEGFSCLSH